MRTTHLYPQAVHHVCRCSSTVHPPKPSCTSHTIQHTIQRADFPSSMEGRRSFASRAAVGLSFGSSARILCPGDGLEHCCFTPSPAVEGYLCMHVRNDVNLCAHSQHAHLLHVRNDAKLGAPPPRNRVVRIACLVETVAPMRNPL